MRPKALVLAAPALALALALALAVPARADFAILSPATRDSPPPESVPKPAPAPGRAPDLEAAAQQDHPARTGRRHRLAIGFGDRVPLSFAIRQITPPGTHVIYGPGAHGSRLVDWRGGKPWPEVLRAAIRPLGLRLTLRNHGSAIKLSTKE